MKKILLALFATANLLSLNAFADKHFVGYTKFYELIQDYKNICKPDCVKPYRETVIYTDNHRSGLLSRSDLTKLRKIASKQAYIWMDTILEGEFHADGHTELDEVIAIFYSNEIHAYKITYSERAWFIGECEFDGQTPATLQNCAEGRIRESSYVSPDLKTFIRNDDDIADFYN